MFDETPFVIVTYDNFCVSVVKWREVQRPKKNQKKNFIRHKRATNVSIYQFVVLISTTKWKIYTYVALLCLEIFFFKSISQKPPTKSENVHFENPTMLDESYLRNKISDYPRSG